MAKEMMIILNAILLTYSIKNCDGKFIDFIHNRSDFQCVVFATISVGVYRYARAQKDVRLDMLNGSCAIIPVVDSDSDSDNYGMC